MSKQVESCEEYALLQGSVCMWRNHAERIVELCEASIWSKDLESYYHDITVALASIFSCGGAQIYLFNVTGNALTERSSCGRLCDTIGKNFEDQFSAVPVDIGRMPGLLKDHQPIFMDCLHKHPDDVNAENLLERGIKNVVCFPLIARGETLGFVNLMYEDLQEWSDDSHGYLLLMGRMLGAAIQRTQFFKNSEQAQILEERKYLSAEIHDTLAHMINSMRLEAEATMIAYEKGDFDAVTRGFRRQEAIGQQVSIALRAEMLSLRTPSEQTGELLSDLDECLDRFSKQWILEIEKSVMLDEGVVIVSTQTELQVVRIINECLTNVLRHSAATRIKTSVMEDDENQLLISISDDGCGFDPIRIPPERLGIRIMKERARTFGGEVAISSEAGLGTTVTLTIPNSAWLLEAQI